MQQETDITLVVTGIAVMLLLFASVFTLFMMSQKKKIKHQEDLQRMRESQQNQLIEAAIRSEESVRHSISESLHDEVGAILSSSKLHLQAIRYNELPERDKAMYEKSKSLLDEGIQKVRSLSHSLHSNILKELGLNEAINHFVTTVCKGALLDCSCHLDPKYPGLGTETDISLYRIIQELINNIIKHANARHIEINSRMETSLFELRLQHDGDGLSQTEFEKLRYQPNGLGLKNIQNRVILLKGEIRFEKDPGKDAICIRIPIKNPLT